MEIPLKRRYRFGGTYYKTIGHKSSGNAGAPKTKVPHKDQPPANHPTLVLGATGRLTFIHLDK